MNRFYQKTRVYEWYSAFKSDRDVVEDLPRSGQPSTFSTEVNIAKVKETVTENRHLSLRKIVAELSVFHKSVRTILNDCLGMKRVLLDYFRKTISQGYHCERIYGQKLNGIIEQLPYSPDMAPADFFLFQKIKLPLRGTRFHSIEDIKGFPIRVICFEIEKKH